MAASESLASSKKNTLRSGQRRRAVEKVGRHIDGSRAGALSVSTEGGIATPSSAAALRGTVGAITALLVSMGVMMVYSASISLGVEHQEGLYLRRHLTSLAVGIGTACVAAAIPARRWRQLAIPLFVVTVVVLVAVLLPGVGSKVRGAQRWFRWGGWSFQPAEIAKITLVLLIARLCTGKQAMGDRRKLPVLAVPPLIVAAGLVLAQPDFGTAAFLGMLAGVVMYVGGVPIRYLVTTACAMVPLAAMLLILEPYRVKRMTDYVQAWNNPDAAPYHMRQSLITLGSGGLTGSGLGKGWQKLSYLPEANNDFVFAVIGEELGLVGTLTVVGLWGVLLLSGLRLMRIAVKDPFAYLAGCSLIIGLVLQAMINVAVVTALLPPKGIPLPLVSYGGSSLLASLVTVGIVLGLARSRRNPGDDCRLAQTG